jgi:RNA polymerase sigma-70 factor (ECF subfamily)
MHNKPELQLIADFRNGDVDAIAELFQRHYASSLRVARRILRARDESPDAVQSAYLSAFRNFGSFRGESSFKTWITKIVINQCVMYLRRSSRQRRWVSLDDSFPGSVPPMVVDQAPTPEDLLRRAEMHQKVVDTAGRLPRPLRDVFVLRQSPGSRWPRLLRPWVLPYPPRRRGSSVPAPSCAPHSATCAIKRTEALPHQHQNNAFPVNAR